MKGFPICVLILSLLVLAERVCFAETIEKEPMVQNESADSYLQEGHERKKKGDLEGAIQSFKKALEINPDLESAEYSLEKVMEKYQIKKWLKENIPEKCRSLDSTSDMKTCFLCAEQTFTFHGMPIHPKIIEDLSTWLSDRGDQVVAINLAGSQHSNRYCCESDIKLREIPGEKPIIYYDREEGEGSFGYQHIGKTNSGIHVLFTSDSGGGSGIFRDLMLVRLEEDIGASFDNSTTIKLNQKRVLIIKIGEIVLGDRYSGNLKVEGNKIFIGKDASGRSIEEGKVITIE